MLYCIHVKFRLLEVKMVTKDTIIRGSKSGVETIWTMSKVILPVFFIVKVFEKIGVIAYLANLFEPLTRLFGLPGEAAVPLVLGNALNIYAALAAIEPLDLTAKHITILAVMLSFSHTLPVETAVSRSVGVNAMMIIGIRIGLAGVSGILLNVLL